MRAALCCVFLVGSLVFAPAAQANIVFQFDFGSPLTDAAFLDPTYGAERQAALQAAADSFSSMFASHFSNSGTIRLDVTSSNDPASNTLASAGSYLYDYGSAGVRSNGAVMTQLQTGANPFGATSLGTLDVNFAHNWQLNGNLPVSNTQYDFTSTMFHELTHVLGFAATIGQDGSPIFGTKAAGEWDPFTNFLVNAAGVKVINANFSLNQAVWNAASAGGGTLYFNGAHAMAANGGQLVALYSPNPYEPGSSVSHISDAVLNLLMLPSTGTGLSARDFSAVEVGILLDLGYTLSETTPTPVPGSVILLSTGLTALVGWRARRRRA
ncbi:MAG: ribonuclease E [Proteobacteria bacterium]|nr:ribonuclease E [Pseudomonadota bacterium]MBU1596790.1 ribonuclease E [Pseudomonadota bacterium]